MRIRRLRTAAGSLAWAPWMLALWLAGCQPAQQAAPHGADSAAAPPRADAQDEARQVAQTSLGKDAEILARGNLALNGREQLLVINRISPAMTPGAPAAAIFVTRAAVLEKDGGKWSQILLCDEHLKNPDGYLGASPAARATGWRLEYSQDAEKGLEMKLTPAERQGAAPGDTDQGSERTAPTFDVRWNKSAKRYQTYDQSHERYLSEVPSLETPQSILK